MFRDFLSHSTPSSVVGDGAAQSLSPALRSNIYSAIDQVKSWTIGGLSCGTAGDGVSYGHILTIINQHFPDVQVGFESRGSAERELAVIVGATTNMILELSRWDGMASGMALRTWAESLAEAHGRLEEGSRKDNVARGITRGVNENTNVALIPTEFVTKIQVISVLKGGMYGLVYYLLIGISFSLTWFHS